jgi:LysM repeat protein
MKPFLLKITLLCIFTFPIGLITAKSKVLNPQKQNKEETQPIFYTVKDKETLYRVSVNNHVSVENLKKWNKLTDNNISAGSRLIVGHEKSDKDVKKTTTNKVIASISSGLSPDEDYIDPKYKKEDKKSKRRDKNESVSKEIAEKGIASWIDDGSVISNKSLALHKSAPAGTIIKITNTMNGKHQYVKVVGTLPADAENKEVDIKVTKTIAQKLGVLDKFFRVEMQYALETAK